MERARKIKFELTLRCISCNLAKLHLHQSADGVMHLECDHSGVCRFEYEDRNNRLDDILDAEMERLENKERNPFYQTNRLNGGLK